MTHYHQQQGAEGLLPAIIFLVIVFLVGVGVGFVIRVVVG